jgi:hypothetical protein
MKPILAVVLIGFALSLCNLSERFKKGSSSSGTSSSSSSSSDGPVERAQPTAAQAAAIAGGKEAKWDRQNMSFTVPSNWTGEESDSKSFMMRSPGGADAASLIVSISPMPEDFPADSSIQAYYDSAKSNAKNGEVDEVRWLEIDGLKGVQFREANKEDPDDHRRMHWMAYRKYTGQLQYINIILATQNKDFERHKDAMYGVLYSLKLAH